MPNPRISSHIQMPSHRHWIHAALKSLLVLSAVTLPLGVLDPRPASAAVCSTGVITRTSSPVFYIDTGESIVGNYVSYTITNTSGSAYADLWVKLESFSGGRITLAASEDGIVHVGSLANGASKTVFFYLANTTGTGNTSTAQSHTVSLYSTRPDLASGSLCGNPFSQTVEETIKAVANKVTAVVAGPNPPELGGIMTITVTGDTGTIGAAGIFAPTPASYADWPANSYKLVGTQIKFISGGNTGTFNNILYKSGLNSPTTNYQIVYTFVAAGVTTAPTSVTPVTQINSGGTNMKHNDTGGVSLLAIQPASNKVTLTKSVSSTALPVGGTVTYTITLNNTGAVATTLDDIIDILPSSPSNATYVSDSAKFNNSTVSNPNISGQTLTFLGLFTVPAGGTSTLTYQATIPSTNGTYTNSAIGHIGSTQIDTTLTTGDNAPATATVNVGTPDLTLTKSHTGNFTVGSPATYALTVNNTGSTSTSGTITVIDTLPLGFTIPNGSVTLTGTNAANWSCSATSNVISCTSSTAIAAGSTSVFNLTGIQVGASAVGSVTNNAVVSGGGEVNVANDSASDVTTVNGISDLTLTKSHTGNFTVSTPGTYALTVNNIGSAATSGTITLTDTLPTGLTMPDGAVVLTGTNAANWSCTASGNVITCTTSTIIASSGSSTFNLTGIQVGSAAVPSVTNTASVSGGSQTNTANDSASDPTIVNGVSDLTIAKTHTGNFTQGQTGATYTLTVTNSGTAATTGSVTVIDTVPTGLTATAAAGTGWTCTLNMPAVEQVQCTRSDGLATGSSYPPITLTVDVASNAASTVTNSVSVSGGAQINTGNDTATDPTIINAPGSNPNVLLVKRITAINGSTTTLGGDNLAIYNQDDAYPYDDNTIEPSLAPSVTFPTADTAYWPNTVAKSSSSFLIGGRTGGETKPQDEVEYTIYFLSTGTSTAHNVMVCDRIPPYQTFIPDAFNSLTVAPNTTPASPLGDRGIEVSQGGTTYAYTNIGDGDAARYYPPGSVLPSACTQPALSEDNGTIVVNLGDVPNATAPGTPTNSYGFLRFRARVK
jgi:uncharacterized repeat protein (TIGR01451 family)